MCLQMTAFRVNFGATFREEKKENKLDNVTMSWPIEKDE